MKKVLAVLLLLSTLSYAQMFEKGNLGLGIAIGSGSVTVGTDTQNYVLAGVSFDYYIADNMSVGLGYLGWFGATPSLHQVTLPVHYYIPLDEKFRPYAGAFLRETFASEGYEDYESYGVKAGLAVALSKNAYLGAALVQEYYGNCTWQKECSQSYPEIVISFMF